MKVTESLFQLKLLAKSCGYVSEKINDRSRSRPRGEELDRLVAKYERRLQKFENAKGRLKKILNEQFDIDFEEFDKSFDRFVSDDLGSSSKYWKEMKDNSYIVRMASSDQSSIK